jgi:hypothetical protein
VTWLASAKIGRKVENQHWGIRILGEQIVILESFAALQKAVQRCGVGREGSKGRWCLLVATKVEKLRSWGGCSCYGALHAYLGTMPEAQPHGQGSHCYGAPLIGCDWLRVIQFLPWNAAWLLAKQYIMSEFCSRLTRLQQ